MSNRTVPSAAMMIDPTRTKTGATLAETGRLIKAGLTRRLPPLVPAAAAEAVEIGRQDRLDRGRRDAERSAELSAPGETMLSRFSSSTWSGVSGGFGSSDISRACSAASAERQVDQQRLRRISRSSSSISSRKV